jgi:hypothetical protein
LFLLSLCSPLLCKIEIIILPLCRFLNWPCGCCLYAFICNVINSMYEYIVIFL